MLVVDNGSVYTKNLTDFLIDKNIHYEKIIPELLDLKALDHYDSFILSGRRKNEKKTNEINSKIINYTIQNDKKLLGICYGAEILALTLGGTIKKSVILQRGNEKISILKENPLFSGNLHVFESHGFEISKLPDVLIGIGESKNCKFEIIQYDKKPIFGTQFHPEMSDDGKNLILKFCSI
ncbi:glutamine amidotransferase class-I [Candidatus Nitrosarchaeum limnium SFB1]|uniref:Glutamine amidotransferase class-I n=1 Tax=Candidatus Nitrosarchaeum limnium SFB1 TaxID=886738 RepID=F3KN68_9ARCH|nr:glutamine amidotransferase class-I [Candidatus Nitrosarchaeum limnium SFB1]